MTIKPMLADDWSPRAYPVVFPVIKQPKIDGVRGQFINEYGAGARSLRPFSNLHTTNFFSQHVFRGLDGELAAEDECHPRLCSLTTSATSTIEGQPWLMWHVFDYITPNTYHLPYDARLEMLADRVKWIKEVYPHLGVHLKVIPWIVVDSMEQLEEEIEKDIDLGYEGTIIRKKKGEYKQGRSTAKQQGLLRIKPFMSVDAIVQSVIEGRRNENEATINALGHTERSTHQENMVPNGMVGAVMATLCEDVTWIGNVIHKRGDLVRFSAGRMTHEERKLWFEHPELIVGKRMQGQIFPKGIKDKPRFPTFQCLRSADDVVER